MSSSSPVDRGIGGSQLSQSSIESQGLILSPTTPLAVQYLTEFARELQLLPYDRGGQNRADVPYQEHDQLSGSNVWVCKHPRLLDALFLLRAEIEVLLDFDASYGDRDGWRSIVGILWPASARFLAKCLSWPVAKFTSFAKYHTAAPMADFLGNSLPPNPSTEWFPNHYSYLIWSGQIAKLLKQRIVTHRGWRNRKLFWGFLQGIKRGTKVVDESFILASLVDHAAILSLRPPVLTDEQTFQCEALLDSLFPLRRKRTLVLEQDSGLTEEIGTYFSFEPKFPLQYSNERVFEPSNAAAYENPRSGGGAREFIRRTLQMEQGIYDLTVEASVPRKSLRELNLDLSMFPPDFFPKEKSEGPQKNGSKNKVNIYTPPFHSIFQPLPGVTEVVYSGAPRLPSVKTLLRHVDGSRHAKVSAVLEPLKVRLITKSAAFSQAAAKSAQKTYWEFLKEIPAFVLTSRPLSALDFNVMLEQERLLPCGQTTVYQRLCHHDSFWVSGDYKAATDGLNLNLTKLINEFMMQRSNFSPELASAVRDVLYEQEISYPKNFSDEMQIPLQLSNTPFTLSDRGVLSIQQNNGQLMGSIVSFPVLCVANLLCYWLALNEFLTESGEKEITNPHLLPVKINGDDILFRSTPRLYEIWLEKIQIAGFKLSVGKNYTHSNTFTINSQCFTVDQISHSGPWTFSETTYLNTGLLIGRSDDRVTTDRMNTIRPISQNHNLCVLNSMCPARTQRRFLHYNKLDLNVTTFFRGRPGFFNLFVPETLQGLGLEHLEKPSFDNRSASRFWKKQYSRSVVTARTQLDRFPPKPLSLTFKQSQMVTYMRNQRQSLIDSQSSNLYTPKEIAPLLSQTFFKSDVASPTFPMRKKVREQYLLQPKLAPLPGGFSSLPSSEAPVLFEASPTDPVSVPTFEVVHPHKSVIRRMLKTKCLQFRSFATIPEDFYVPYVKSSGAYDLISAFNPAENISSLADIQSDSLVRHLQGPKQI